MFGLVLSADLLSLLVFWDLLGFSSFFLVIFFRSRSSLAGGFLTALSNRIGDCCFLLYFGTILYFGSSPPRLCLCLVLIVSITKSAQVPFSAWLPAAMSAPTPVSALVHSSTLVTAGVYLLYRFVVVPTQVILVVGIFTTLVAGAAAVSEADVKKIIALSTLSQLGIMVSSIGLGARGMSFLHLNLHAFTKALLFLVVGIAIHSQYGSQEVRSLSSFAGCAPLVFITLLIGSFSLCGLTFLSCWVSKEAILRMFYNRRSSCCLLFFFYFGIGLTVSYSSRMVLFSSRYKTNKLPLSGSTLVSKVAMAPLYYLLFLSVLVGG